MPKVFISYNSQDKALARSVNLLLKNAGFDNGWMSITTRKNCTENINIVVLNE